MSHGVHAVQHEVEHKIKHEEHGHGLDGVSSTNKKMALVIAVLALYLSFAETVGKSSQTAALNAQMEATNLWGFYQAKNIRRTDNLIAVQQAQIGLAGISDPQQRAAMEKQIEEWNKTAARYKSEPEAAGGKGEGTEELSRRAQDAEHHRDEMLAKYHNYEFASAAFQIGIVLASAAVITGLAVPGFIASGIALAAGAAFMGFGLFAPHLLHLG
mgnify:CR=1 FL=1